jgi:hypothetical protein
MVGLESRRAFLVPLPVQVLIEELRLFFALMRAPRGWRSWFIEKVKLQNAN